MSIILRMENATKKFGGLIAVNQLSFEVKENTIHALIGPNGSGKTTVINLINGLLKLDSGSIFFRNEKINGLEGYRIARKGVCRTFQNIKLFRSMNVLENVMLGGHPHSHVGLFQFLFNPFSASKEEKDMREKAEEILSKIGMYHVKDEMVGNLPYGMQKKLEIGRAIMGNPCLLLLDEPAAGLNPSERSDLVELLTKLFEDGIQLLLIEHNMDVVMNISHRITVLNFGAKIAEGSPNDIQNNEEVIKAYLGDKSRRKQTI